MPGIMFDVTLDNVTNRATAASQCPFSCLRVLHLNPARLKVLKTPYHNVREDHVALAPYRINTRQFGETSQRSIAVSSGLSVDNQSKT